ncbi:phospholipid/cholesterol/gamma-HCH transport system substrate-binding protein [Streptomyces sp. SLBN-118]|uniref:MCE family protein n=1 Tax=Streptomyces sp. SLBN-118 TaxID=2768454 RepID=UPI00116DB935|nr:MCE family protein [Streptomyces sp. SLBN-118]TQK51718.1 phospholipid/cholesterol/gamma-HCH transport system substrate-binding protein [Streptomyces sp. SLBN-118]
MSGQRSLTGPAVKSLIFILVTALATTVLALSVAGTDVDRTRTYKAWFTDATGLGEGDSVRIAGVQVGRVESMEIVQRRYAQVTFSMDADRRLPASATASIKYLNMVGQRFVDLGRGAGPVGGFLPEGATIPLRRTAPALDLTQLFNGFQPLMQGLSPAETNRLSSSIVQVLQGEGGTVEGLLRTIGSVTTTVAAKDQVIGEVIGNLNRVLKTVNTRQEGFTDLVETVEELVSGFAGDRKTLGKSVDSLGKLSVSTADLFGESRAPLKDGIRDLRRVSGTLADNGSLVENFLTRTPQKMAAITRIASYGSWLNLYLCEARLSGVNTYDGSPPPTGLPLKDARCRA